MAVVDSSLFVVLVNLSFIACLCVTPFLCGVVCRVTCAGLCSYNHSLCTTEPTSPEDGSKREREREKGGQVAAEP